MPTQVKPGPIARAVRQLRSRIATVTFVLLCGSAGALQAAGTADAIPADLARSAESWQLVLDRAAAEGDCVARLGHYVQSWTQFRLPNVQALDPSVDVDAYLAELERTQAAAVEGLRGCPVDALPAIVADLRKGEIDDVAPQALEELQQKLGAASSVEARHAGPQG